MGAKSFFSTNAFWIAAVLVLVLDQLTKYVVQTKLSIGQSVPVLQGIFHLTYVQNTGVAFGMFGGMNWVFALVAVLAIIAILYYRRTFCLQTTTAICAGLILGGALGNLADRLALGFVVDFIDFIIWPKFNIADSALTIGVIGLLWWTRK